MQVTELSADGLKRQYKVVVEATDIEARVGTRLAELQRTIRMPGFRPGKVPVGLLRKQYGRSVMGEILEQAVNEGSQQAISDNEIRPALRPKIEVVTFDEGTDLEFTMDLEVLPKVPEIDLKSIELTRLTAEVGDDKVTTALEGWTKRFQEFEPAAEGRASALGDRVVIDFEGRVGGELFDGGKGEEVPVVLGSGFLVPGFEDQLVGAAEGDEREVEVTFPEDYPNESLAGQAASFAVRVQRIEVPKPMTLDDDLAKARGFDDLAAMQKAVRDSLEGEYARHGRNRIKRALLDHLAETLQFEVPGGMVEMEFDAIWKQLQEELERSGEESDQSEEELRSEYQAIADRRVRLGLILSDIGQANDLKVEQHELNAAVVEQARSYPGQEQKVVEFFRSNPQAIEHLRAPLYEDKVVDFVLQMATVTEQVVTPEELMRDPDAEDSPGESEPAS